VSIGDFAADLVGIEATTKRAAVIENQLSKSDHDHLGKILTYSSDKKAGTIIWIATEFRQEHRQTLEWLNDISQEGIFFFAVQLEVLVIDSSRPSPYFKTIVGPPPVKTDPQPGRITPKMEAYHRFFSDLLERLKTEKPGLTNASKISHNSWFGLSAGRTGFGISIAFAQGNRFRVELYIDTGDQDTTKQAFEALQEKQAEIEAALGGSVAWERLDTARASRIAVYYPQSLRILDSEEKLATARIWAVDMVGKFKATFAPLVERL
jgi:hypothetical protein